MDPDANLAEQLMLAEAICAAAEPEDLAQAAARLSELVLGLEGWLSAGGWRPRRWRELCAPASEPIPPPQACPLARPENGRALCIAYSAPMSSRPAIERSHELAERRRRGREAMARIRALRRDPLPMLNAARLMREVREDLDRRARDTGAPAR